MKNPLYYQHTEFDCGPTSLLNGISYLFEREEIPAEVVRNIMLYCLDCYGAGGSPGESGTSCMAMMFLSNWLDGFGRTRRLPVMCRYLANEQVYMSDNSKVTDALRRGGVVVLRLHYEGEHYVLLTGVEGDRVLMFDPYYELVLPNDEGVELTLEHPFSYNRIVPFACLNKEDSSLYAMGPKEGREAVVLFNHRNMLTPDNTIEYVI